MLDTLATVIGPIISVTVITIVPIIITDILGVVPGVTRFAAVIPRTLVAPVGTAGSRLTPRRSPRSASAKNVETESVESETGTVKDFITDTISVKNTDPDAKTLGTATIREGETSVTVETKAVTEGSRVNPN